MTKVKTFLLVSAAAGLACSVSACHPALDLQGISAAFIQCEPSNVVVGNDETHGWLREWDALYQDEEWHCVRPTWAQTSTSWVGTECRRVRKDSVPVVARKVTEAPQAEPAPWITYNSDACGVTALFPNNPTLSNEAASKSTGTFPLATYGKPDGTGAMTLGCATVGKTNLSLARLLDGARTGMLANVKGTLLSERPVLGGREVHFTIREGEAVARLYLVGEKLLFAMVLPVGAFSETNTQRFLDSVRSL